MDKLTVELPTMFADHHVTEVRRLIFELSGISEVYASSGFRYLDVTFDESKVSREEIEEKLEGAGYLGELPVPEESNVPVNEANGQASYFRHTSAYEQTKQVVGFTQTVPQTGRPLWPCPGMGPIQVQSEE